MQVSDDRTSAKHHWFDQDHADHNIGNLSEADLRV